MIVHAGQDQDPPAQAGRPRERLGADPDPEEAYWLVTGTMPWSLTQLSRHRKMPIVG